MSTDSKESVDVGGGVIYNALEKNYYYWNTIYYNYSQPKTKITADDNVGSPVTGSEVIDKSVGSSVNVIGLLAALVVSLVIIIGVAFVIRTIRKHQSSHENNESSSSATETKPEIVVATTSKITNPDQEENQTSFTLTFTEIPNEHGKFTQWMPKALRPKPKKVDIEKLKKELGQIYVY